METAWGPERTPEMGSARIGQPAAAAKRSATSGDTLQPHPATSSPLGVAAIAAASPSNSSASGSAGPTTVVTHGRPPGRPSSTTTSSPGTSGSRKARLRWTGPAGGPDASATDRAATDRQ